MWVDKGEPWVKEERGAAEREREESHQGCLPGDC